MDKKTEIVIERLGFIARLLSASKSFYMEKSPGHKVFFNGNIFDSEARKIWYGDIDITADGGSLQEIADVLEERIYVTLEQPWRWREDEGSEKLLGDLVMAAARKEYPSVLFYEPRKQMT